MNATPSAISSLYFTGIAPSAIAALSKPKMLSFLRCVGLHHLQRCEILRVVHAHASHSNLNLHGFKPDSMQIADAGFYFPPASSFTSRYKYSWPDKKTSPAHAHPARAAHIVDLLARPDVP